jgi:hypothetical protein
MTREPDQSLFILKIRSLRVSIERERAPPNQIKTPSQT